MLLCRTLKPNDKFSGIKAPSNELRQQSSRSSRDQSELYFQYFVTNIALCTTLKPNGKISGNLWVQQSQVKKKGKKNWKCDSQELFERKLVDYFVHHSSRKRFFRKGFEPEVHGNLTRLSFLPSRMQ